MILTGLIALAAFVGGWLLATYQHMVIDQKLNGDAVINRERSDKLAAIQELSRLRMRYVDNFHVYGAIQNRINELNEELSK